MRKRLFGGLMVCSVAIMLTGMPLHILHIDTVDSAYAWGHKGGYSHWSPGSGQSGQNQGDAGQTGASKVPEPSTMALLGAGIAGVGMFSAIRYRKSKKK